MPDAVLLPNGTVFVCNGSDSGRGHNAGRPVTEAEVYDPDTNNWSKAGRQSIGRLYHATALLLPDGRVLAAGTDCSWNPYDYGKNEMKLEIFSPPYCFGDRPDIGSNIKSPLFHGEDISVPTDDADEIDSAALVRCGSVTHSFNSDQRYVGLRILERRANSVRVAVPSDSSVAPPGPYMLFLLNRRRIPSIGRFVVLSDVAILHELPYRRPVEFRSRRQAEKEMQKKIEELQNEVTMLSAMIQHLVAVKREPHS
jgi:hypothetical protein